MLVIVLRFMSTLSPSAPTLFCAMMIFLLGGESLRLAMLRLRPMLIELKSTLSSMRIIFSGLPSYPASRRERCDTFEMLKSVFCCGFISVYCRYLFKFLLKSHFNKSSNELSNFDSSIYLLGLITDISFSENGSLSDAPNDLYILRLLDWALDIFWFCELELLVFNSTRDELREFLPLSDLMVLTGRGALLCLMWFSLNTPWSKYLVD